MMPLSVVLCATFIGLWPPRFPHQNSQFDTDSWTPLTHNTRHPSFSSFNFCLLSWLTNTQKTVEWTLSLFNSFFNLYDVNNLPFSYFLFFYHSFFLLFDWHVSLSLFTCITLLPTFHILCISLLTHGPQALFFFTLFPAFGFDQKKFP